MGQPVAPGPNMVGEYQASGIPWVTSSNISVGVTKFEFPTVTRHFTVRNDSSAFIKFGFTENGVAGSNHILLATSQSYAGELRIKDLFLSTSVAADVSVIAGLTLIPRRNFPILTGSIKSDNDSTASDVNSILRGIG